MPAAVAVPLASAGITAASALGGGLIQSRSAGRALDAEERARKEALDYQRTSEWRARLDAREQYDRYMRSVYGDRYQPNGAAAAAPAAAAPVADPKAVSNFTAPGVMAPLPSAAVVEPPPLTGTPVAPPMQTMADLPNWSASQYTRYLGGRR